MAGSRALEVEAPREACRAARVVPTVRRVNDLVRFAMVAFFPRMDDLPGLAELDVDAKIADFRRESTWLMWTGVVAAALVFQLAPILTLRRPWLAVSLTPEELDLHAHQLSSHPFYELRQLIVLLKLTGGMMWGQSPEVRAFLDLPAYPADPGTRRTEAFIARTEIGERAPVEALVQLGRREVARGRHEPHHASPGEAPLDAPVRQAS
ncbi:MAG: hypothetical protein ABIV93_16475 [Byssovorax sp.]